MNLLLLAKVRNLGKMDIPERILSKEGPLTDEKWRIMRRHPEIGYRIALSAANLSPVADLILKHHERWDGSGYPLRLKGEESPVECRIVAIVDAYDAMISRRLYRKVMSSKKALEELKRCAGSQFDPKLASLFLTVVSR